MYIEILKSKIHNVRITQAELHYVGSITIDEDLLDAAQMQEFEKVLVVNQNNGERLETYIIKGERGSGIICMNGPAARKVQLGDIVIVMSFASVHIDEAKNWKPILVFPNEQNRLI
ncbi:MAG: aspartate 1-decarboxylase [Cytophagaceae bacterium]|nr:aspartate 1-decarboxylase [Cytophagaceae bacterium]MDW8455344.1 aspartate 1-decarboxylase [Cytophagaceae bacterium]